MRALLPAVALATLTCGDTAAPAARTFVQVSAGAYHACALTADGTVWCWGANTYGALGNGGTTPSPVPVRAAAPTRFTALASGLDHTCGLAVDRRAWCWGINLTGQLGDGSQVSHSAPVPVVSSLAWRTVSAGEGHTCATTIGGGAWCWGASLGPAGDGTVRPPRTSPTALGGPDLPVVSVGYEIACGLTTAGGAMCWGLQPPGVVLTDGKRATDTPTPVTASPALASISAGHKHACALDPAGAGWCWGLNAAGQVGDGTTDTVTAPVRVAGGRRFIAIDAHAPGHTCAIEAGGAAWCWGANTFGQLGNGFGPPANEPARVAGGLVFTSLSVGFHFTCGVADGTVWCWGYGGLGQLGDGTATDHAVPVRVADPW